MKRHFRGLWLVVMAAGIAAPAAAQTNVARFTIHPNRVYTTFGLDPAVIPSAGYARVVRLWNHPVQLSGEFGIPISGADVKDYRARIGGQSYARLWRSLHATGSAAFVTRGTENSIYSGFNFGADFTGTVGLYDRRWFVAAEGGFDKAIITHVSHSDWYRTYFFDQARDGWYLTGGGTFHYGLTAGITVGRVELSARYGWLRTEDFNDLVPPVYGGLGAAIGF